MFPTTDIMIPKWNAIFSVTFLVSLCHVTFGQVGQPYYFDEEESNKPWDEDKFKEESAKTYNLIFHKYNQRVRPPVYFVEVDLAVTLAHIRYLDLDKRELQTVLDIEVDWIDSRLRWNPLRVKSIHSNTSSVWCPDIIYTNGVSSVKNLYPDIIIIMSDGAVRWSRKEIVTTQCRTRPQERVQHCSIELGFLSNIRGDNIDRYFTNKSSVTLLNDFENHQWRLTNLSMDFDDNNDTKSTTIGLDLTLESKESREETSNGQDLQDIISTERVSIENCTETQYEVDVDEGNKASNLSLNTSLLLLIVSLGKCLFSSSFLSSENFWHR